MSTKWVVVDVKFKNIVECYDSKNLESKQLKYLTI